MAKRINILSAGGEIPFADNVLKLSKSIRISEIEYHEDFKSLFAIDENLLKRITDSMLETKYDNSQPIHIGLIQMKQVLVINLLLMVIHD